MSRGSALSAYISYRQKKALNEEGLFYSGAGVISQGIRSLLCTSLQFLASVQEQDSGVLPLSDGHIPVQPFHLQDNEHQNPLE